MKTKRSWLWVLSLGLATLVSVSAMAQRGDGGHHRGHGGGHDGKHRYGHSEKRNLSDRIYRITNADSTQKVKMKPAVDRAAKRLDALRANYQKQEKRVMDSLALQVKPYLKEEQLKKLSDWNDNRGK